MKKITFKNISSNDIDKINKFSNVETKKQALRQLREKECYVYINRGEAWYKRLTDEQKAEFDKWYQAWLDVTETFEIPQKPDWVK